MRCIRYGILMGAAAIPLFAGDLANLALEPMSQKKYTTSFIGEFLYWRYSEATSDFLRTGVGQSNSAPIVEIPVEGYGTRYTANFGFEPGWRASLACSFGEDNAFDVSGRYTSFHTIGKNEFNRAEDLVAAANSLSWFFDAGTAADTILLDRIKLDLNFNLIDLVAGYKMGLERHYYIRPFAGMMGYFAKGKLDNEIQFLNATSGLVGNFTINKYEGRTSVWGIGALVGFDGAWNITRSLSIVGSFDFRSFFNKLYFRSIEPSHDFVTGAEITVLNFKYNMLRSSFMWDFKLGPRWDSWYSNDRYHLSLTACWEIIDSLANMMGFLSTGGSDVGFGLEAQGLSLSGMFEF